jgi:hypothetical protein
LIEKVEVMTL